MAEWIEQHARTTIPGWEIDVTPGMVTVRATVTVREMDLAHAIELRDTLTEAIERASGSTPVKPEPRVWLRRSNAPEPADVRVVEDSDGDRWERGVDGWNCRSMAVGAQSWPELLGRYGPLTEVL